MTTGAREDPYLSLRFQVEVDSLIVGGFSEATGLQVEVETEDYREGGVNDYVHKLPKGARYPNLILKRGVTDSDVLWKWHQDVVDGKIEKKSGRIMLLDQEGNVKWRWAFEDAYPIKWTGPDFKADTGAVAVEAVELVHRGIRKA
jgi:phage tail-like protein